jgi:hypothetical protein
MRVEDEFQISYAPINYPLFGEALAHKDNETMLSY